MIYYILKFEQISQRQKFISSHLHRTIFKLYKKHQELEKKYTLEAKTNSKNQISNNYFN